MKIKIESDVFDIVDRIKEIDDGYFIVFDTVKNKFEIHNCYQNCSYCFTSKYDYLSVNTINEILTSLVCNIDNIVREIDKNNKIIEQSNDNKVKDYGEYTFQEIYKFYNNSSKQYDQDNAFSTIWR